MWRYTLREEILTRMWKCWKTQQKSLSYELRTMLNDLKSELIHFESYKTTFNQMIILLNNMIIKSKTYVWWLEVWLNQKLNFKVHVQTKIATVTRMLHSLFKLMNSEWRLNVKSEKQLYLICITSISDYDVEIWWNNQKSYLVKFYKLQNTAL